MQAEVLTEAGVDLGFVGADARDQCIILFEGFNCVTEALSLDASEKAVGPVVEIDDQRLLAEVIAQFKYLSVVAHRLEVRGLCPYL